MIVGTRTGDADLPDHRGYTPGGADMLRRAMGKKKPEEMAKHQKTIAAGARQKGYDPALAEQLFDLMTKFAEYGFNKSHTAAYAVVTTTPRGSKALSLLGLHGGHHVGRSGQHRHHQDLLRRHRRQADHGAAAGCGTQSDYRFVPTDWKTIRYTATVR